MIVEYFFYTFGFFVSYSQPFIQKSNKEQSSSFFVTIFSKNTTNKTRTGHDDNGVFGDISKRDILFAGRIRWNF